MASERRPDWRETESFEDAARRLMAIMDERARKKAAERLEGSAQIADRPKGDGGAGSESGRGGHSLNRCRPTDSRARTADGLGKGADVRLLGLGKSAPVANTLTSANGCARPAQDDTIGSTDRTKSTRAPGDGL